MHFEYDLSILRRAAYRVLASNYQHYPGPDEIADTDWLWETNVNRYIEWIEWLEEPYKRKDKRPGQ